jgi:hypothetical protein
VVSEWAAGLVVLLVVPLLFGLMWWGWRGRARRQADVPPPADAPPATGLGAALVEPVEGLYVSTVRAGEWLDRVVVHGLGVRSDAVLHAGTAGLWFSRTGARDLFVPASDVLAVRVESGIAGKYTIGEGLLVLRWRAPAGEGGTCPGRARHRLPAARVGHLRRPGHHPAVPRPRRPSMSPAPGTTTGGRAAVPPAVLLLEDGRVFRGEAFGAVGQTVGEAVFSTGMTGYQETLTDPSYHRQVVVMTAPHVGNTGINDEDSESRRVWVAGYVVRDPAPRPSSWRATRSLADELVAQGTVGIGGVDTRAVVRHLRERGVMRAGSSPARPPTARWTSCCAWSGSPRS